MNNILIFIKNFQNVLTLYKYVLCSGQSGQPDLFFLWDVFYERIKKIKDFNATGYAIPLSELRYPSPCLFYAW